MLDRVGQTLRAHPAASADRDGATIAARAIAPCVHPSATSSSTRARARAAGTYDDGSRPNLLRRPSDLRPRVHRAPARRAPATAAVRRDPVLTTLECRRHQLATRAGSCILLALPSIWMILGGGYRFRESCPAVPRSKVSGRLRGRQGLRGAPVRHLCPAYRPTVLAVTPNAGTAARHAGRLRIDEPACGYANRSSRRWPSRARTRPSVRSCRPARAWSRTSGTPHNARSR